METRGCDDCAGVLLRESLWPGEIFEIGRNGEGLLELGSGLGLLTSLMKRERKIVVGFCVTGLEAKGLGELSFGSAQVPGLQLDKAKVVVGFGESWVAANQFAEDVGSTVWIVVLVEDKSQLYLSISVFRVQADGFLQFADCFRVLARLSQVKAEVVVRLSEVGI